MVVGAIHIFTFAVGNFKIITFERRPLEHFWRRAKWPCRRQIPKLAASSMVYGMLAMRLVTLVWKRMARSMLTKSMVLARMLRCFPVALASAQAWRGVPCLACSISGLADHPGVLPQIAFTTDANDSLELLSAGQLHRQAEPDHDHEREVDGMVTEAEQYRVEDEVNKRGTHR